MFKVFCSHFLEKARQGEDPHKTHTVGVRWVQKEKLRLSVSVLLSRRPEHSIFVLPIVHSKNANIYFNSIFPCVSSGFSS